MRKAYPFQHGQFLAPSPFSKFLLAREAWAAAGAAVSRTCIDAPSTASNYHKQYAERVLNMYYCTSVPKSIASIIITIGFFVVAIEFSSYACSDIFRAHRRRAAKLRRGSNANIRGSHSWSKVVTLRKKAGK